MFTNTSEKAQTVVNLKTGHASAKFLDKMSKQQELISAKSQK